MTANLMGLTARTGQQAVPWTHLPRGCPPLAAGPPPRRVCFLGCSQTALEKGIRSCYLPNSLAVQSPVWLRGGGGSLQGSGLQPPRADLPPQALGQPVGSGRPLGPLASVLPCHKLQAGCFVLGKPQLDPRGMRVSLSTRTQPCQRTPRPSAPLPPLPSPPSPGDHPVVGGAGRTTAPVHPPGSTCCLLSTKKCASRGPWAAEQSLQPTVKAIPVVKLP